MWFCVAACALLGTKLGVYISFTFSALVVVFVILGSLFPEGTRLYGWPTYGLLNSACCVYLGLYGLKIGRERGFFPSRESGV
jgi:hypothetical protein